MIGQEILIELGRRRRHESQEAYRHRKKINAVQEIGSVARRQCDDEVVQREGDQHADDDSLEIDVRLNDFMAGSGLCQNQDWRRRRVKHPGALETNEQRQCFARPDREQRVELVVSVYRDLQQSAVQCGHAAVGTHDVDVEIIPPVGEDQVLHVERQLALDADAPPVGPVEVQRAELLDRDKFVGIQHPDLIEGQLGAGILEDPFLGLEAEPTGSGFGGDDEGRLVGPRRGVAEDQEENSGEARKLRLHGRLVG